MKPFGSTMIALVAASVIVALPAFASGSAAAGRPGPIKTAAAARQALHAHGLADIRHLWHIGDYWESEVESRGEVMVAYLFDNGVLWLRHYPHAEMRQAFGGPTRLGSTS